MGHSRGDKNDRCGRGHANRSQRNDGRERTDFEQRVEIVSEFEG